MRRAARVGPVCGHFWFPQNGSIAFGGSLERLQRVANLFVAWRDVPMAKVHWTYCSIYFM
jgi:hypothetical protein